MVAIFEATLAVVGVYFFGLIGIAVAALFSVIGDKVFDIIADIQERM